MVLKPISSSRLHHVKSPKIWMFFLISHSIFSPVKTKEASVTESLIAGVLRFDSMSCKNIFLQKSRHSKVVILALHTLERTSFKKISSNPKIGIFSGSFFTSIPTLNTMFWKVSWDIVIILIFHKIHKELFRFVLNWWEVAW